jgi:hypothetical protein
MGVAGITLAGVQFEGNLLAADMTAELLAGSIKGQAAEDFGLAKTEKLEDEIAIAWGYAKAYWADFQRQLNKLNAEDTATSVTREVWAVPLLRTLGYTLVYTAKAEIVDGQTYAISHRAFLPADASNTNDVSLTTPKEILAITNYPPIHIMGCRLDIDKRPPSGTPRLSAHGLVQEYLNKTEHLWAIATNGLRWRLLRDSSLMTRLTYIEFDLEQILNGENFAEFGLFYRLFHRSRLPKTADDADKCLLEYYHQESLQQGGRVRDRLRDGVEKALKQLGNGFIQHLESEKLRQKLTHLTPQNPALQGNEDSSSRLVGEGLGVRSFYRQLLRLIYRLLFLMVAESRHLLLTGKDAETARIYQEYYSIERLREFAERPRYRREGFQDIWQGLRVTLQGKEEHDIEGKGEHEIQGNEENILPPSPARKGAGGEVISAAEEALLSLKVIDPACGSGHFLLAAARRIAKELAKIRTGESQPAPEPLRQAVRDVIQNCIYGVDLNSWEILGNLHPWM